MSYADDEMIDADEIASWGDEDAPTEGDYVISDCGRLGSRTRAAEFGGRWAIECADEDEALDEINTRCIVENFFPNVWRLSDHGNYHLIQR